ncbi:aromatic ring-hydroxylating dioxygenase subunit alpha [soil metagenome]
MPFLKNAWHMIGWSNELDGPGKLVHRTISNEAIVVYRKENGDIAALADRCPHRFVPLHRGKVVGDTLQCGYHGLRFAGDGMCVHHPVSGAPIPNAARVRSFPAVDRHSGLWVWLGDPALVDESTIPPYDFLDDPTRGNVRGYMLTHCNYQLAIDNLADLTHVQFVHSEYQASEAYERLTNEVRQDGNTVFTTLTFPDGISPPFFVNALPDPDMRIDLVNQIRWDAPSNARLTIHGYRPGDRSEALFSVLSAHIVTAETESTCHYFFCNSRNYAVGDPAADQKVRDWQRIGFTEQDKPMLEAQQAMVGEQDLMSLRPVLLATDAGSVRIRRVLKGLMESESQRVADSQRPAQAVAV